MTLDEGAPVGSNALRRVIWALHSANMAVQARKERQLRPLGMAAAHYSLLISVNNEPGLTAAELSRRLNVTPQAVASLVGRLTEKGYLERRSHARHRHVQELHLTDAGRQALGAADAVMASIERQVAARLGREDAARLRGLLADVVAAVRTPNRPE